MTPLWPVDIASPHDLKILHMEQPQVHSFMKEVMNELVWLCWQVLLPCSDPCECSSTFFSPPVARISTGKWCLSVCNWAGLYIPSSAWLLHGEDLFRAYEWVYSFSQGHFWWYISHFLWRNMCVKSHRKWHEVIFFFVRSESLDETSLLGLSQNQKDSHFTFKSNISDMNVRLALQDVNKSCTSQSLSPVLLWGDNFRKNKISWIL